MYKDQEFTSDQIGDHEGFVYLITDLETGMKYVGQKSFWSTKKLPPLKGKKRKRTVVRESDWRDYFSSSKTIKYLKEQHGRDRFRREILHLCQTKGEMNFFETKEQFDRDVLFRDDYYNGIINCRIAETHVKNLRKRYEEIGRI